MCKCGIGRVTEWTRLDHGWAITLQVPNTLLLLLSVDIRSSRELLEMYTREVLVNMPKFTVSFEKYPRVYKYAIEHSRIFLEHPRAFQPTYIPQPALALEISRELTREKIIDWICRTELVWTFEGTFGRSLAGEPHDF
jgi:hypothetical protein